MGANRVEDGLVGVLIGRSYQDLECKLRGNDLERTAKGKEG